MVKKQDYITISNVSFSFRFDCNSSSCFSLVALFDLNQNATIELNTVDEAVK